jgi:hypothetical protein
MACFLSYEESRSKEKMDMNINEEFFGGDQKKVGGGGGGSM